ncbi:MAG: MotA/TolQ/ExbB proton channel family protein [Clostridia bacterium]|nr:MotA/TolQ/ExbB proton channel family protein [Clostridia bacterium]
MSQMLLGGGEWLGSVASAFVYIAIIAIFIVGIFKCVIPVAHARARISRATHLLKQGEKSKHSWQEDDFLGRGAIYPHWKEYLNNLFFADGVFHNPSNIEDFINEDTVIYGPGRSNLAEALPGVMVSLGFLGTLVGITEGLRGFSMDDAEQVMAAIRQLVPGMRYAFLTSIAGVVASILFTLINRIATGGAKNALTGFYAAMKQYAGVVAVDPMTQIAIYQQEQTALIQKLSDHLTGEFPARLAQSMTSAMNETVKSLKLNVDDFIAHTTQEQLRGIDMMARLFIERLNALTNDEFTRLGQNLSEINRVLMEHGVMARDSMDAVRRMSANVVTASNMTDNISKKLDESASRLSSNAKASQDALDRLCANAEHLEIVASQFNNYIMNVNKLQSQTAQAMERFDDNSDRLMNSLYGNVQEAMASLKAASVAIRQSSDTLAASHKLLAEGITGDIDQIYNSMFKSMFDAIERVNWSLNGVRDALDRLPAAIDAHSAPVDTMRY